MKELAAAVLIVSGSAAQAQDCIDMYQMRSVVGLPQFYREDFGTVGFSPDDGRHVYIPDQDSVCVTVPRRLGPKLHFYFNNRHADGVEAGYVSFKLYGISNATAARSALLLQRSGDWTRGTAAMAAPPWKQINLNKPAPATVQNYEAAYRDGNPISEQEFDQKFGAMHGQPAGSRSDSWNDRGDMQPDDTTINPANVAYLAHSLQRTETNPQMGGDSDPPNFVTSQLRYDTLVMRSFSPLGQDGESTTLTIRLGE